MGYAVACGLLEQAYEIVSMLEAVVACMRLI